MIIPSKNSSGTQDDQVVRCKCGHVIGRLIHVNGAELLDVNGIICREVHGFCPVCKNGVNWTVSDRLLLKILARYDIINAAQ